VKGGVFFLGAAIRLPGVSSRRVREQRRSFGVLRRLCHQKALLGFGFEKNQSITSRISTHHPDRVSPSRRLKDWNRVQKSALLFGPMFLRWKNGNDCLLQAE
jgi:hypothetical protein